MALVLMNDRYSNKFCGSLRLSLTALQSSGPKTKIEGNNAARRNSSSIRIGTQSNRAGPTLYGGSAQKSRRMALQRGSGAIGTFPFFSTNETPRADYVQFNVQILSVKA